MATAQFVHPVARASVLGTVRMLHYRLCSGRYLLGHCSSTAGVCLGTC